MKSRLPNIKVCRLMAKVGVSLALGLFWLVRAEAVDVLTQHNDLSRDGANLLETNLTPANVNVNQFGKLFTYSVDGQIYAQPLYVQGLTISGQNHNVVFVCTENDSVYAIDADSSSLLWHVSLGTAVPAAMVDSGNNITPLVGITSTPVIDTNTGTIYVEAKTTNNVSNNILNTLHALSLTNGAEKFGGPTNIQATANGITFNSLRQLQRPGLLLLSNVVYLGFGSHQDTKPYNGWLIGYNATNLAQVTVFNTTPASLNNEGAIWSCGMAPAADTNGNIYVMTGNGTFDANSGGSDYGQCFLKLSTTNGLAVADWFAPWNANALSSGDKDIGTGGPVLLPGNPPLVIGLGKFGTNYVLNSTNFGHFSQNLTSDTNIIQEFAATPATGCIGQCPVYWKGPTNQFVYISCGNGYTTAFNYTGTNIQTTPLAKGSVVQGNNSPGGSSLSANGNTNGILWVIDNSNGGTLRAYNAAQMPAELWDSTNNAARDAFGEFVKFCAPTIVNGKVYVPGANELVAYGSLTSVVAGTETLAWTAASGTDTNWSTALNWTNITTGGYGPPGATNNVLFNNTAAVTSSGTINNVVNGNVTIASLQYANNNVNTSPNYHTTLVGNGQTLVVTNGVSAGTGTDAGSNFVVNAAITGANGTLVLTNGVVAIAQGSGSDGPHQAVLDLSGLGTLNVTNVSRIAIAVSGVPPQTGNGVQRCSGVLYLAKTNNIAVTSTGVTNGILVGWNDSQGNGNTLDVPNPADDGSALYLGQTNTIFTDAIYVGTDKSLGCLLAFNPNGLNNPVAYFRGIGGASSRVSLWGIGDTSMKNGSNQSASGTNDFTSGSVNILASSMNVGVTQTGASGGDTGTGTGVLTFNAGTIDVNYLTNGWSVGSGTNTTDVGTGTVNVNSTATLKVNSICALAQNTGTGTGVPSGALNVNGGTFIANSIVAGAGT
ncbi:MAG TPA: hypothetical protein VMA13_00225, partial [Candidatus Saccharimonadales bacterium]|nr:hypothetical protein [Candidatus Saccharimonadales bacterium]